MGKIVLENVNKHFGDVHVVQDVSLAVEDGEFVVFVGPSGCGKSTLLRSITGLEEIDGGCILIDDRDVSELRPSERQIAMVFQSYALFPHITVRDNISFGLKIAKTPKDQITAKVAEAARILSLGDLLDRYPRELSGGQRQRVAIGRAIVRDPVAFLFDEPLSNLDAALRVQMRIELIKLRNTLNTTMVYVTHDQVEAMTMADRIAVLNDGRVEQYASPLDLYDRPRNLFVAAFIGSPKMNLLQATASADGRVQVKNGPILGISNLDAARLTGDLTLGIRPEHLVYAHDTGDLTGTIVVEEQLGSDAFLYVDVQGIGMLTVRAVGERDFHSHQTVHLTLPPERCHVFDASGLRVSTI